MATILSGAALAQDEVLLAQASNSLPSGIQQPEAFAAQTDAAPTNTAGTLSLDDAIAMAMNHSPKLQSFEASRLSSRGERRQAGQWVNPEASIGAENIAGQGQYKGLSSAQITYGVSQLVEIGGKRSARKAIADRGIDLADFDYQAARLDLIRDVTQTFARAVAAAEKVKLAKEQQKLANAVLQSVARRVDAAREPLIQKSKANVALASSRIAVEKAEREYEAARKVIANLMNEPGGGLLDSSEFYQIAEPRSVADINDALAHNPDITRWKPAIARSEAALDLEKANAVPDPRVSAGVRDNRDSGDRSFVAGISFPFPVLNRNQGNIAKARAELVKADSDQKASKLALGSELTSSLQAQQVAYVQATTLKDTVLPEAERAFMLSRQGYESGKFAYLEVLDAQRTLVEARLQYIEALQEYHTQRANVERLTATQLPTSTKQEDVHDQE